MGKKNGTSQGAVKMKGKSSLAPVGALKLCADINPVSVVALTSGIGPRRTSTAELFWHERRWRTDEHETHCAQGPSTIAAPGRRGRTHLALSAMSPPPFVPERPATPLGADARTVQVDGVARPARNSRDQLLHWSVEGARNFWRWFGDSKALDHAGRPLVLYHATHVGTNEASGETLGDIESFDRFTTRRVFGREALDQVGSWFSDSPGATGAGMYGGTAMYPVYVRVAEPWSVRFEGLWRQAQKRSGQPETARPNAASVAALDAFMDEVGIDGVRIVHDPRSNSREFEAQDVWVARSPEQIKSAIGNSGLFDPASRHLADPLPLDEPEPTTVPATSRSRSNDMGMHEHDQLASAADADLEYATNVGSQRPNQAWILSDRDVWYRNPSYKGPPKPHPEDAWHDDDLDEESPADAATGRNDSVVLVEPSQLPIFEKRLAALNKKARTFGLEPIKIVETQDVLYERVHEEVGRDGDRLLTYLRPVSDGQTTDNPVMLKRIEIEYPEIKLGNWRVVGKFEAVEGGNLSFAVSPDADDLAAIAARVEHPLGCEHCQTHRKRKDGYVLRDASNGEYKQVGSSCLEDFTGIDPAAALFLARMADVVRVAEGELEEFGRSSRVNAISTRRYLADVSFISENVGFVSSAKARDTGESPTYSDALAITEFLEDDHALQERYNAQFERHAATADAVRAWVASRPEESSFDRNVKLLLQADAIARDRKHLAFAAAAVAMYTRSLAATSEARKPSEHVGTPGQKMTATLTVERVIGLQTFYGDADLVLLTDESGNRLKWKTSACPDEIRNGGVGRSMEASFKIKEHDDYKGSAQTTVTHLKVYRWLNLDQELDQDEPDPVGRETEEPRYRVSLYLHEPAAKPDAPRNFSNPVIDNATFTRDELVSLAREKGVDRSKGEGEFRWYASAPDDAGREFSLYVHEISGSDPSLEDHSRIEALLGEGQHHPVETPRMPEP